MDPKLAYDDLARRSRERTILASCGSVLGWDEQTYMPKAGSKHRGDQMAVLAGLVHERGTDPVVGDLLRVVEESSLAAAAGTVEAVNIREWRRDYDRQTRLPRSLVEELARTTSMAQQVWVEARGAADFGRFRPWLGSILALKRSEAQCLGGEVPYDALLDEYEPGARSAELAGLFATLREELVTLVGAIANSPRQPDAAILARHYPVDRQQVFAETVAAAIGFDFKAGRLDTTAHPFCSGIGPGDTRITTRYDAHAFGDAFFGVLHEVGHGLYDQGLSDAHYGTPMGEAISLGIHESQSRLWENAVGRSRAFWVHWFPIARSVFREALDGVALDDFVRATNRVAPSLIRVEADEVTYNLHILIRFELERALLSEDLAVNELPDAWNQKYQDYLGIRPGDDAEGCLQDIHWSAGLFGYFPTYTLGNLYAAQLFARANEELGGLDEPFARGEYATLLDWLRLHVHQQGKRHHPADLIRHATGSSPGHLPLVEALRAKYGELYGL